MNERREQQRFTDLDQLLTASTTRVLLERMPRLRIGLGHDGAPDDVATTSRGCIWKSMNSRIGER
jgi:hypothetical protein